MEVKTPLVSSELVEYLCKVYSMPEIHIDTTINEILFHGGKLSVLSHLKGLHKLQSKDKTK